MLLETIIGLGVLIFILWKFLLPAKQDQVQYEIPGDAQYVETKNKQEPVVECSLNHVNLVSKEPKIEKVESSTKTDTQVKRNLISYKSEELITPSLLLKQRKEKQLFDKVAKRESPPKEKLAEFLEKTILSDDKIQSIIHNLSLDKTEILIHDEPPKVLFPTSKEIISHKKEEGHALSENAAKLQETIDNVADRIKRLNAQNIVKEIERPSEETIIENVVEEPKPVLKRLQKQPGFPPGLNFGSVIGELKNKTKNASNGGLKPVFKKFDVDTVDNVQAGYFYSIKTKKHINRYAGVTGYIELD